MPPIRKTDLLEAALRLVGLLGILSLLLSLMACGPGLGGTGTGPVSSVVGGPASFSSGPGQVLLPAAPDAQLAVQAERVELVTACFHFVHEGAWGVDERLEATVEGTLQGAQGIPRAASLQLAFSAPEGGHEPGAPFDPARSREVTVTLLDGEGRPLHGPTTLGRQELDAAAPVAGQCRP